MVKSNDIVVGLLIRLLVNEKHNHYYATYKVVQINSKDDTVTIQRLIDQKEETIPRLLLMISGHLMEEKL
jgi:hypothetical protein